MCDPFLRDGSKGTFTSKFLINLRKYGKNNGKGMIKNIIFKRYMKIRHLKGRMFFLYGKIILHSI